MNRASARRSVVASLAVALVVAACSSAATSSTPPSAPSAAAQPAGGGPSVDPGASVGTNDPSGAGERADYCSVFSADRLAIVVGQPVHVGDVSDLYGMGCRWDTADGKGGVVIQRLPVHLGYDEIAAQQGQRPVAGIGDKATIGPGAFADAAGDLHTGTIAAAVVGDGFASVTVAPRPADDVVIGLLTDLVAATR